MCECACAFVVAVAGVLVAVIASRPRPAIALGAIPSLRCSDCRCIISAACALLSSQAAGTTEKKDPE